MEAKNRCKSTRQTGYDGIVAEALQALQERCHEQATMVCAQIRSSFLEGDTIDYTIWPKMITDLTWCSFNVFRQKNP